MPRGPRVSEDVVVWAKAADVLRGHPQLKPELERLMPQGLVGKWMRGVVKSSVARTVARKAIWQLAGALRRSGPALRHGARPVPDDRPSVSPSRDLLRGGPVDGVTAMGDPP